MCVQTEPGRQTSSITADLTEETRPLAVEVELMRISSQLLQERTRRHTAEKKFKRLQVCHHYR